MSDDARIDGGWRHRDRTAVEQWSGLAPDEAVMAMEENGMELAEPARPSAGWIMETLMVYLFADRDPDRWQNLAARALAVMAHCTPWLMHGRSMEEVERVRAEARPLGNYHLTSFREICEYEASRELLGGIMRFLFPECRDWIYRGSRRTYLVAREYQPALLRADRLRKFTCTVRDEATGEDVERSRKEVVTCDATYEDFARIFEGVDLIDASKVARNKARSRWSARAQEVVRKPIEAAGGVAPDGASKGAEARAKMSQSAMGNSNRRKRG